MSRSFKHSPLVDTCSLAHRAQVHVSYQALLPPQSAGIEEPEQKDISSLISHLSIPFSGEGQGVISASRNSTLRLRLATAPSCRVVATAQQAPSTCIIGEVPDRDR